MKNTTASEKIFQKAIADKAMVFCFGRVGKISPGVTGAAPERPLEGVTEDPTGVGHTENAHSNEWA